jgi:peptide/nickel transport system substrate-binding protein
VQVAELLIGYWDKVGVKVILNSVAGDLFTEIKENNEFEATLFTGEGGAGITGILDPRYYVPGEYHGMYGNGWYAWRVGAEQAVQVEMPQHPGPAHKRTEVLAHPQDAQRGYERSSSDCCG